MQCQTVISLDCKETQLCLLLAVRRERVQNLTSVLTLPIFEKSAALMYNTLSVNNVCIRK